MSETLLLTKIRLDGGTQPRAEISEELVDEYRVAMNGGATFPPVVVFYDGTHHWLADGFHRVHARKKTGHGDIPADIRQGTKRDAILYSLGANADHGMRRSNEDKRRAVERMLVDRQWRKWSDQDIARQCAVSAQMVGVHRKRLADASLNGREIEARQVRRGGRTYTMKVSTIGKRQLDPDGACDPGTTAAEVRRALMSLREWLLDGSRLFYNLLDVVGGKTGLTWADDTVALCMKHGVNLIYEDDVTLFDQVFIFLNELREAQDKQEEALSRPQQDGEQGDDSGGGAS